MYCQKAFLFLATHFLFFWLGQDAFFGAFLVNPYWLLKPPVKDIWETIKNFRELTTLSFLKTQHPYAVCFLHLSEPSYAFCCMMRKDFSCKEDLGVTGLLHLG